MDETVLLGHGSGGTMMKRIIDEVFFSAYAGEELLEGNDAATLPVPVKGESVAFSTDSFVVTPHFCAYIHFLICNITIYTIPIYNTVIHMQYHNISASAIPANY